MLIRQVGHHRRYEGPAATRLFCLTHNMPTIRFGAGDKPPRYGKAVKWNARLRVRVKPIPCMLRQSLGETTSARMACGHRLAQLAERCARSGTFCASTRASRSTQHERILAFSVRAEPVEGQVYTERCIYETSSSDFRRKTSRPKNRRGLARCQPSDCMTPIGSIGVYSNVTSSVRTLSMVPPA